MSTSDRRALAEIKRVLRPGAAAVLVIPSGPGLYDYYDRFLHHERRYARGEMADKAREVGLLVEADLHLGSVVYPAFWALKKRNRLRFDHLAGSELEDPVRRDYGDTKFTRFQGACEFDVGRFSTASTCPSASEGSGCPTSSGQLNQAQAASGAAFDLDAVAQRVRAVGRRPKQDRRTKPTPGPVRMANTSLDR